MAVKENVKVIGLTGMSGAGKSTACKIFKRSGFIIIDCDKICREIVEKGRPCLSEISAAFGNDALTPSGELNRAALAKIIFSDESKRLLLNGIMYPYVSYIIIKKISELSEGIVILDAPTLFDSGTDSVCDGILSVVSDKNILIERLTRRDNISAEAALLRLGAQKDEDFFAQRSDILIKNNGSRKDFISDIKKAAELIRCKVW